MDNFKTASQLKLRFNTDKGMLTTEQLWDLTLTSLTNLIKSIKKTLKDIAGDDELAFLTTEEKEIDIEGQLMFEIAKDVYLTKKKQAEDIRNARSKKESNQKILELIEEKKNGQLANKTIEELEAMLQA